MSYAVAVEGLQDIEAIQGAAPKVRRAAALAINRVTTETRGVAAKEILSEVRLPPSYVAPNADRLSVFQKANRNRLEAGIRARGRPTSLARFVVGRPRLHQPGLTVAVQHGRAQFLQRAFLVRLRRGAANTDTQFNAGLAIRLARGQRPAGTTRAVELSRGLFLLYGPSIAQVFLDNQNRGVAVDLQDPTAVKLQNEFLRLLAAEGL